MRTFSMALILSAAVAMLAQPAGTEAGKRPKLHSFAGICDLEGVRDYHEDYFLSGSETTEVVGTCQGRVNGGSRITVRAAKMKTTGRAPLVEVTARGAGFLRLRGLRGRLYFRYERTADRALELIGERSRGRAVADERSNRYHVNLVTAGDLRGL